jgi:hypothetical protein
MLTPEQKNKIKLALDSKILGLTCPMCQSKKFVLADGYFNNTMQTDFNALIVGGQSIPTIGIICTNCGFLSQHAIGVLGLLPKPENQETNEPNK